MSIARKILMGAAGAGSKSTYVDDVFSTYLYKGNSTTLSVNNGVDNTKGGIIWFKARTETERHMLFDTERGTTNYLQSNNNSAQTGGGAALTSFDDDGYTLAASGYQNNSGRDYTSWNFRKQEGFCDIVTWTGDGVQGRQIPHNLGSVPGCIMIKAKNVADNWKVYHRGINGGVTPEKWLIQLNDTQAASEYTEWWNDTAPTATNFTVGQWNNESGWDFIAYVFAGGESTAATARSVKFNQNYIKSGSTSDYTMGTGDFTIECWYKPSELGNYGVFQLSSGADGLTNANYENTIAVANNGSVWMTYGANGVNSSSAMVPTIGTWYHLAFVKTAGKHKLYVNGIPVVSVNDTNNYSGTTVAIGGYFSTGYLARGDISNFRITKGQALYTSAFKPPTAPLTTTSQGATASNVKLICCNDTSVTGSTVTGATISVGSGSPTAITESPFDDSEGFQFGEEEDQNLIKCGYYKTDSNEDATINLGWEPQWVLAKRTDSSTGGDWFIIDSMRGFMNAQDIEANNGGSKYVEPNTTDAEANTSRMGLTSTGFYADQFGSNRSFIYLAIRRSDGYVGKPVELGTGAFNVANYDSTAPAFNANFPVDFAMFRRTTSSYDWRTSARLIQTKYLETNTTDAESIENDYVFDYNDGWNKQTGYANNEVSWLWKRHAGFDVVAYKSPGGDNFAVNHNLGKIPEMMWLKRKSSANYNWTVYHKGLNGGTNPQNYGLHLNSTSAEVDDYGFFADIAPNATTFQVGYDGTTGSSGESYLAMLFASVDGISKVGSYSGTDGSNITITTGFQPRFIMVKKADGAGSWHVFDTVRGMGSGNDPVLMLNNSNAQVTVDYVTPSSTGWQTVGGNLAQGDFIYYAHA